jgi:hypothetical protein
MVFLFGTAGAGNKIIHKSKIVYSIKTEPIWIRSFHFVVNFVVNLSKNTPF